MTIYTPHLSWHRNPLAYPAGYSPGFDPWHLAAKKTYFSAVSNGTRSMINILTGASPNANTTSSGKVYGPIWACPTISNFTYMSFVGFPTDTPTQMTQSGIFVNNNPASIQSAWGDGGTSSNEYTGGMGTVQLSATGEFTWRVRGISSRATGWTIASGVPYFFCASSIKGSGSEDIKILLLDLNSGVVRFGLFGGDNSAVTAPTGTITIGNPNNAQGWHIAAAMSSRHALSIPEMLQWAADPWSFWYPNPGDNWIAAQAAAGFPYWAAQNNNFVIGTGVQ